MAGKNKRRKPELVGGLYFISLLCTALAFFVCAIVSTVKLWTTAFYGEFPWGWLSLTVMFFGILQGWGWFFRTQSDKIMKGHNDDR